MSAGPANRAVFGSKARSAEDEGVAGLELVQLLHFHKQCQAHIRLRSRIGHLP